MRALVGDQRRVTQRELKFKSSARTVRGYGQGDDVCGVHEEGALDDRWFLQRRDKKEVSEDNTRVVIAHAGWQVGVWGECQR